MVYDSDHVETDATGQRLKRWPDLVREDDGYREALLMHHRMIWFVLFQAVALLVDIAGVVGSAYVGFFSALSTFAIVRRGVAASHKLAGKDNWFDSGLLDLFRGAFYPWNLMPVAMGVFWVLVAMRSQ